MISLLLDVQIGARRHTSGELGALGYVDVVNCSQSMLSPCFASYMRRTTVDDDDDDDDDDEDDLDDGEDDEENDDDDVMDEKLREFPKISEC